MPEQSVKDYTLEIEKSSDIDKKIEAQEVPIYFERLELQDTDKVRLQKEIWDEWDEIKKERDAKQLDQLCDALDNQYEGKLREDKARQFNIDRGTTQVKVDKVVSLIMQSITESDPKFSVTPRPEFAKEGGIEICGKQEDFLDDRLDNLPSFEEHAEITVHSTVLKGTGFLKVVHLIRQEKRRREERYIPTEIPELDAEGNPRKDPQGNLIIKNKGLEEFLQNWPKAKEDYPHFVEKLQKGEELNIIANYDDIPYNDPYYKNVNLKNFYARLSCDGYEGLKSTKLTIERMPMTWWELEQEAKKNNFYDLDKLKFKYNEKGEEGDERKNYKNETYNILECVYYGKAKEADKEEIKMVLWFDEESKVNIGAILYPYYAIDCYYVPHYIMKKDAGLYGIGIGQRMTGNAIAENAILNFTLEGAWLTNSVTPITNDQEMFDQFIEKRFAQGVPIKGNPKDIDFLNKYMRPIDVQGLLGLMQYLVQSDDDKSGVSSGMSGKADPTDPTAPMGKTLALLQQSGINIRGFQKKIAPAINEVASITLALYYQMSKEGRKYRARPERVVGNNPFSEINRNEMRARTNIQTMATAYDFDKLNLKREIIAFLSLFRNEPLIAGNPEAVHLLLKLAISNWGQLFKNIVDKLLPTLPELQKAKSLMALKAVDEYIKAKNKDAQVTGMKPEFDLRELMPLIDQLTKELVTAPPPEVQKERMKANEG